MYSTIAAPTVIHTFEATSADEAISLTRASELFQFETFIATALVGLRNAKPVLDRFSAISRLATSIGLIASGTAIPVTVATLEAMDKSEAALRGFFNSDGPMLGNNLDEANANYIELNLAGIEIDAPIQVPVLVEIDNKDGKGIIKSLSWISAEDAENISKFPELPSSQYPGGEEFVNVVEDAKGNVIKETKYTVFKSYANRRANIPSLAEALVIVNQRVAEIAHQVLLELQFVKSITSYAEENQLASDSFKTDGSLMRAKIIAAARELVEAATRLRTFLHRERQLLIIRMESSEIKIDREKMQMKEIQASLEKSDLNEPYLNFINQTAIDEKRKANNKKADDVERNFSDDKIINSEEYPGAIKKNITSDAFLKDGNAIRTEQGRPSVTQFQPGKGNNNI